MERNWDSIIIGGGAAGLSAALVLGRGRRQTLLMDAGNQSNLPDTGVGALLGHEGLPPAELYAAGRRDLEEFPTVEVRSGTVVTGTGSDGAFELRLEDGRQESARKLIFAMGMDYVTADLPGLEQLWGRSVFHCPFCHGWDVRDGAIAVRGNGPTGIHAALMIRGWSDDVVLLTDGPADLDDEQRQKLAAAGIPVDERPLADLKIEDDSLSAIGFTEGEDLGRDALMVAPKQYQRSDLPQQFGVRVSDPTPMAEDALEVDAFKRTSVDGIFAAGDLAGDLPQVSIAAAAGSFAGMMVIQSLLSEDFGLPLPPAMHRD
jgi:thioredoxin reductase